MDLLAFVVECVFPTRCVVCEQAGEWWCARCRGSLEYVRKDLCASCASVSVEHRCAQNNALDGLVAAGFYHARPLRVMLQALKYHGVRCVVPPIGDFFHDWKQARTGPWPWAGASELAVQPLPAAPDRVRRRGFDQAELMADIVHKEIVPWASRAQVLARASATTAQARLAHGAERDANVRGAFEVRRGIIVPKNILLVDDVVTTGSTMREAARILRRAGAQKIYGLALAVGA